MDRDSVVLQGAFAVAEKRCAPSSLSRVEKAEWSRAAHVVLEALSAVCSNEPAAVKWRKRLVCVVWLKLLCKEAGEDVETSWRENQWFCLQNGLPEVSSVVLLELVKSMDAADAFASLLLCFPPDQTCVELNRMVEYVRSDPKSEKDVQFFLNVWWELWKGRDEMKSSSDDASTEEIFTNTLLRLSKVASLSPVGPKRLKLHTPKSPPCLPHSDVVKVLLHGLRDMKEDIRSAELCCQALSVSIDAFYTSFLLQQEVVLPTREKMHFLSEIFTVKGKRPDDVTADLVRDAQRDLHASHSPATFRPSGMTLSEALNIVTDLALFWQKHNDLGSSPGYSAFQLNHSVHRVLTALQNTEIPGGGAADSALCALRGLLKTLVVSSPESSPDMNTKVTTTIIIHHLDNCESFAALLASDASLAPDVDCWLDCLEKNRKAFQQWGTLSSLSSSIMTRLHSDDVTQSRKLLKATLDVFSALSLEEKNKAMAAMLASSQSGFFGASVPSALSQGFEQELNMAFNCIIQGGRKGATPGNLDTAASLVARVAFQNPAATLKYCCHSAVFNKGAFHLMAGILLQLTGLNASRDDDRRDDASSVFCKCLQEVIETKRLSANETEQLLGFIGLLMKPAAAGGEVKGRSFLSPRQVVLSTVLPKLSAEGYGSRDTELCLQLLQAALCVCEQEEDWVMDCSPFPLLYVLAQLQHQTLRCRHEPPGGAVHGWSMDTKELLVSVLSTLGQLVGAGVAADPDPWSRALFWLYRKVEQLDWTVGFYLSPVWGQNFKKEVPSSLLDVCDLPEQEWVGLELPAYGPGTGLLAWMECCSISDSLQSVMLSRLSLEKKQPEHMVMFSKGLMVALSQVLPCCSLSQWSRLLAALEELISSSRLHVPFSLEYVDFLPLLDLRRFSCELRLSVLLLRVLQLLCGSSCSHWLLTEDWAHVGRLYSHAVRGILSSVGAKLPLPSSSSSSSSSFTVKTPAASADGHASTQAADGHASTQAADGHASTQAADGHASTQAADVEESAPSQEVLFVLVQLYCHVQHIQVMMPGGQSEPLFLSSLNLLSQYEAVLRAFPESCSAVEKDDTRHFLSTITENLQSLDMKTLLQQKITQITSSKA